MENKKEITLQSKIATGKRQGKKEEDERRESARNKSFSTGAAIRSTEKLRENAYNRIVPRSPRVV